MSKLRSKVRGDLFASVYIEVPTNLTEEERDILIKFQEISNKNHKDKESFFVKMKNLW